jgi:hypothetical protein
VNQEEQTEKEPSSGNWMWDQIREHLPPHMRDDPEAAKHIGTLIGLGMGKPIGAVLGVLGRIFFGGSKR